jgi:hypothetical protein
MCANSLNQYEIFPERKSDEIFPLASRSTQSAGEGTGTLGGKTANSRHPA